MKKKINGFTLAEVLVTLMIIGVIASMTIPGLKNSAEERERVAQLKKAYSTVANATSMLETEYGSVKRWNWGDPDVFMDEMYIKQFNVAKNCKNEGGCFAPDYRTKGLNGRNNNDFQNDNKWYTFVTADGAYWAATSVNGSCTYSEGTYTKNSCLVFEVDLNGVKKPNTIGYDIFAFEVTAEGVFPIGGCPGCDQSDCNPSGNGWGCTAKVLQEGKISY